MALPRNALLAAAVAFACLAAWAVPASGATLVGYSYPQTGNGGCLALSWTATAVGGSLYVVPVDGVLTSWSHGAASGPSYAGASLKFKVYRPTANASVFLLVGQSGYEPLTQGVMHSSPTRIPVKAGDLLGLRPLANFNVDCSDNDANGRAVRGCNTSPCADSTPGTNDTLAAYGASQHLNISALLEADADVDGFGDETQDDCPLIKGSADGCISGDLFAAGSADFLQRQVGDPLSIVTSIRNDGPDPVPAATVTQTFPAGLQPRSDASPQNPRGMCTVGTTSITCPVGTLAPGDAFAIGAGYFVTATGSHVVTTTISSPDLDTAKAASASAGDPNAANNANSFTVEATAAPPPPPASPAPPVPPAPTPGGGNTPVVDRSAPTVDIFRFSRKVFTTGRARRGVKKGTGFVWLVTERGKLEIGIEKRNSRGRYVKSGTLSYTATTLRGSKSWSGKIGTKTLGVGSYRATLRAIDAGGNRSKPRKATFRIVR